MNNFAEVSAYDYLDATFPSPSDCYHTDRAPWRAAAEEQVSSSDYRERRYRVIYVELESIDTQAFVATLRDHVATKHYWLSGRELWAIDHWFPTFSATETVDVWQRMITSPPRLPQLMAGSESVQQRFYELRDAWKLRTSISSDVREIVATEEYQAIIKLGGDAVPLIIDELRKGVDHWFWALQIITGEDQGRGAETMNDAAQKWIAWFDNRI